MIVAVLLACCCNMFEDKHHFLKQVKQPDLPDWLLLVHTSLHGAYAPMPPVLGPKSPSYACL